MSLKIDWHYSIFSFDESRKEDDRVKSKKNEGERKINYYSEINQVLQN